MSTGRTIHTLEANASTFNSAMQSATVNVNHFHTANRRAAEGVKAMGSSSTAGVRGLLELSRGAEDAAVSFGIGGIQGAIRGSINNLTQFAMMVGGPVTGAVAGFAAAAVAIGMTFIKVGSEADKAKGKVKDFGDELLKVATRDAQLAGRIAGADSKSLLSQVKGNEDKLIENENQRASVGGGIGEERKTLERRGITDEDRVTATNNIALAEAKMVELKGEQFKLTEEWQVLNRAVLPELDKQIEKESRLLDLANQRFAAGGRLTGEERKQIKEQGELAAKTANEMREKQAAEEERMVNTLAMKIQGAKASLFRAPDTVLAGTKEANKSIAQWQVGGQAPQKDMAADIKKLVQKTEKEFKELSEIKKLLRDRLNFQKFEI